MFVQSNYFLLKVPSNGYSKAVLKRDYKSEGSQSSRARKNLFTIVEKYPFACYGGERRNGIPDCSALPSGFPLAVSEVH